MGHSSKYHDIYNALKADIMSGVYPPGSFLPPETELAVKYDVSRTTLRHAVAMLSDENIVTVQQGRGTVVSTKENYTKSDFILFHNVTDVSNSFMLTDKEHGGDRHVSVQGGIISTIPSSGNVSKALKVPDGTGIYRLERLSFVNGIPFSYQSNYFRCESLPGFERFSGQINDLHDLYLFLEKQYGIQFKSGVETISAVSASYFDAKLLSVSAASPLLVFERTSVFSGGVIEYTNLLVRPDIMKINISMSGPPSHFR